MWNDLAISILVLSFNKANEYVSFASICFQYSLKFPDQFPRVPAISFHSTPFIIKQRRLEGSHALFYFRSFELSPSCWPKRPWTDKFEFRTLGLIGSVFVADFRVPNSNLPETWMRSSDPLEIDIWNLRRLLERLSSGVLGSGACTHNCFICTDNASIHLTDTFCVAIFWGVPLQRQKYR